MCRSYLIFVLVLLLGACGTKQVQIKHGGSSEQFDNSSFLIERMHYDQSGLPNFNQTITSRPDEVDARFAVVEKEGALPRRVFDVAVVDENADGFNNPIYTIYQWTGKGFSWGKDISSRMLKHPPIVGPDAAIMMVGATLPLAAGTVGGFVVGVANGSFDMVKDLGLYFEKSEKITAVTYLDYDSQQRLKSMSMSTPSGDVLVETTYYYSETNRTPDYAEVKSIPEGITKRVLARSKK